MYRNFRTNSQICCVRIPGFGKGTICREISVQKVRFFGRKLHIDTNIFLIGYKHSFKFQLKHLSLENDEITDLLEDFKSIRSYHGFKFELSYNLIF